MSDYSCAKSIEKKANLLAATVTRLGDRRSLIFELTQVANIVALVQRRYGTGY
jgi:hypothetical protein